METDSAKRVTVQEPSAKSATVFSSIPVTVEVQLGTATMQLFDLMSLKPGSDIRLDQAIGSPVTVIVNGKKIARGDLYVIESHGDFLGVRITEILSSDLA
jgi:flagellar motor switch protein FliN